MANLTKQDRADILADVISNLEDCTENLKALGVDHELEAEQVLDIVSDLSSELVSISDELWQDWEHNNDAIMRDYYGALM